MSKEGSLITACLLSFNGGLLDAYTYLFRGHVFANAMTGNVIMFGISLGSGEWKKSFGYCLTILAFTAGVFTAHYIKQKYPDKGKLSHSQKILLIEAILLFSVVFIPSGSWDPAVSMFISFACAMQLQTFRLVHGKPFASTICTGNMRSGTEALCQAVIKRDCKELQNMIPYYRITCFFVLGAATGTILFKFISRYLILIAPLILLITIFQQRKPSKPQE